MKLWSHCLPLLLLCGVARAQMLPCTQPPPVPRRGLAPLLYVRFAGGPGLRVTFYQGRPRGRAFDAPVVVGMRPGYRYRLELSHLPGHPGVSIFPTISVLGSLVLPPTRTTAAFPAPVILTDEDIDAVLAGRLVTKLVYLEHPDRASPVATTPGQPQETNLPPTYDLMKEALEAGRPVLLVRMGGRILTPEEAAGENAPNTILHPGDRVLLPPSVPPCVPYACRPFYDPLLGPRPPEEECLHDGGDRGTPAGFDHDGRLLGLDPEDTLAEWTDPAGRRRLTCSNRVCLCVPRFGVLRTELPLGGYDTVVRVGDTRLARIQEQILQRVPSDQWRQVEQLQGSKGRLRPTVSVNVQEVGRLVGIQVLQAHEVYLGLAAYLGTVEVKRLSQAQRTQLVRQLELARELSIREKLQGVEQVIGTAVIGRIEGGPLVVKALAETRDLTVCCFETPCPPDKPLVLVKCADRQTAQPGDVVTFTLRYSNHGGRPITDVAVSDSLAGRLEYVPGSAQADRDAVFTIQENEAGSTILRWEIAGRLLPGQGGAVRFQARVR